MHNLIPLNRHSSFQSLSRVSTTRYRSPSLLVEPRRDNSEVDTSVTDVCTISGSPRLEGIKVSRKALKGYRAAAFQVSVIGSLPGANGPVMVESVRTFVRQEASNLMKLQAPQPRDENGRFASKDSFNPVTDQHFVAGGHLVESSSWQMPQESGRLDQSESLAPWLTVKQKDSGDLEFLGMRDQTEQLPGLVWTRRSEPGATDLIPPTDDQKMLFAKDAAHALL